MNEMEEFFVNVKLPRTDQSLKMKVCPEIQKMEAQLRESLRQLFNDMEPGDEVYIDFELELQDKRGDSQVRWVLTSCSRLPPGNLGEWSLLFNLRRFVLYLFQ